MIIPKEILKILNEIEKYFYIFQNPEKILSEGYLSLIKKKQKANCTNDEYLFNLIEEGKILGQAKHSNLLCFYDIRQELDSTKFENLNLLKEIKNLCNTLCFSVGGKNDAVFGYYPKDGYMGWHTNWDAPGLGILFSWSKEGDGYFKSYNDKTKNFEMYQDEVGWNVKGVYMRDKQQGLNLGNSWHCVDTNCERFSIGFLLSDIGKEVDFCYETIDEFELKQTQNGIWI